MFRCIEIIASLLHNRQEVITLDKIKRGVQQMTRRNFKVLHLHLLLYLHKYLIVAERKKQLLLKLNIPPPLANMTPIQNCFF